MSGITIKQIGQNQKTLFAKFFYFEKNKNEQSQDIVKFADNETNKEPILVLVGNSLEKRIIFNWVDYSIQSDKIIDSIKIKATGSYLTTNIDSDEKFINFIIKNYEDKISSKWVLNFNNYCGYCNLEIKSGNIESKIEFLVLPKVLFLDCEKDEIAKCNKKISKYEEIINEVKGHIIAEKSSPVHFRFSKNFDFDQRHLKIFHFLLKRFYEQTKNAFENIANSAHKKLVTERKKVNIADLKSVTPETILSFYYNTEDLFSPEKNDMPEFDAPIIYDDEKEIDEDKRIKKYYPIKAIDERVIISYDTYPNRFIKFILFTIVRSMNKYIRDSQKNHPAIISDLKLITNKFNHYLDNSYLKYVKLNSTFDASSQVLQKNLDYKKIVDEYIDFIKNIEHPDTTLLSLNVDAKAYSAIYEYWCFMKVVESIGIVSKISDSHYSGKISGVEVDIYYNRTYKTYSDIKFRPDISIEFGKDKEKVIIFDAKFKAAINKSDDKDTNENTDDENDINAKNEDIAKMHAYIDGIEYYEDKNNKKNILCAVILYPGNECKFFSDDSDKPIKNENINENNKLLSPLIKKLVLKNPKKSDNNNKSKIEEILQQIINLNKFIGYIPLLPE